MQPQQPYAPPQYTPAGAVQPQAYYPGPPAQVYPPGIGQPAGYPAPPMPGAYPGPAQSAPAAPVMPGGDQFAGPERVVNVIRPRIMDIGPGRLILVKPIKVETVRNDLSDDPNATQQRLTADVVVLDGPPFAYGGKPEKGIPHTHTATPPQRWPGLWLTQDLIVRQCEREIQSGKMVLGRLVRGQASDPRRNAPWRIDDPTEDDKALARQYLAGAALAPATPVETTPAPVPPGYPGYPITAPPSTAPTSAPTAVPSPTWNPSTGQWEFPQPPAPPMPDPAVAMAAQAYMTGGPGAQYAPAAAAPQYAAQPAAYPPPAPPMPGMPDPSTAPPPPGFDPAVWASMPPEHKAAVLASVAGPAPWQ